MSRTTHAPLTPDEVQELRTAALAVLRHNRRWARSPFSGKMLRYSCPSPAQYPFQWFWDSCFHAVALAHLEPEAAREELELLFAGQQPSGFMPHVIFWDRRLLLRPELYWCWLQSSGPGIPRHSALIQPPVIAAAVERYAELTGDIEFIRWSLPKLDAYCDWLARARDPEGDGLVSIIAPWESGMDHSPVFDEASGFRYPASRRQLIVMLRLRDLVNRLRSFRPAPPRPLITPAWDPARRFRVDDVLVNAVYADGLRTLARLHRAAGEDGSPWEARAQRSATALIARCRGDDGFFYPVDRRRGRRVPVRTVAGLTALLLSDLSHAEAAPLLRDLSDPKRFWSEYPVPSVAMDEAAYCPTDQWYGTGPIIWRGPVWINLNWLLVRTLRRRGEHGLAGSIAASSIALVRRSGFREHYNPHTGDGYGARSFGWSTLVVDML